MIVCGLLRNLRLQPTNIMNEKQIEALRVWACEIGNAVIKLAENENRNVLAEIVNNATTKLNEELMKQPDEGF